ncbi:hypothetical protein NW067_00525 [Mycoplasmopsis cynos]|nr:transcription termination/antitermination NusG family protein [Mycoplasmopsis cynos]UWV77501.1 hypothetical protein NW070_00825 [Mycoplasmopsis cynos]UWV82805.1 hypothetical protein NW067_00525 [Mycoplasmopsis cynos]WAM07839.1 hypothetical protein ONA21_00380 [Mycoplasmopsis cynos]
MHMSDKAWFLIRNTQYVTGLIGSSGKGAKPTPLSNLEIKKMFRQEQEFQRLLMLVKMFLDIALVMLLKS